MHIPVDIDVGFVIAHLLQITVVKPYIMYLPDQRDNGAYKDESRVQCIDFCIPHYYRKYLEKVEWGQHILECDIPDRLDFHLGAVWTIYLLLVRNLVITLQTFEIRCVNLLISVTLNLKLNWHEHSLLFIVVEFVKSELHGNENVPHAVNSHIFLLYLHTGGSFVLCNYDKTACFKYVAGHKLEPLVYLCVPFLG